MGKKALRVRMFAGSNGSGKSTLIRNLKEKIYFGVYLNADEIEEEIQKKHYVDLDKYNLQLTNNHWLEYINGKPSILLKIQMDPALAIKIDHNIIKIVSVQAPID